MLCRHFLTRLQYIEWECTLIIVQATFSTSKGQSVCCITWGGLLKIIFCHLFWMGPLFIRMECQIRNGTLNCLTSILIHFSWQYFLKYKTITVWSKKMEYFYKSYILKCKQNTKLEEMDKNFWGNMWLWYQDFNSNKKSLWVIKWGHRQPK